MSCIAGGFGSFKYLPLHLECKEQKVNVALRVLQGSKERCSFSQGTSSSCLPLGCFPLKQI